jgi:hypothetical protein
MLKNALKNPALRKRAKQFGKLIRHSAMPVFSCRLAART